MDYNQIQMGLCLMFAGMLFLKIYSQKKHRRAVAGLREKQAIRHEIHKRMSRNAPHENTHLPSTDFIYRNLAQ